MDISLQGGGSAPSLVGARNADGPVIRTTSTTEFPNVPLPSQDYQTAIDRAEAQRFDSVYKASAAAAQDLYPLGDKSFTIYKDSSGQYITRCVMERSVITQSHSCCHKPKPASRI